MEFKDALISFRSELGLVQKDIASALHISITAVGQWEHGQAIPSRSLATALLDYARSKSATSECIDNLEKATNNSSEQKLLSGRNGLCAVEHATIAQLIDDASFPIYVCDSETDEILYANRATEQQFENSLDEMVGKKCYECIMRRNKPCIFCHKNQLVEDSFSGFEAFRNFDGSYYRVLGKLINWNGRAAQVRYVFEIGGSVQIASRNELRLKYEELLKTRRQFSDDALAVAHYNLTRGTVSEVVCQNASIAKRINAWSYENVIRALSENIFSAEEKKKIDDIRDRSSLIKLFFLGKTHISIKHRIKGWPGYYEGTFDLLQNPITYDVEAFAALRDITDEMVSEQIISTLIGNGYESISTIDATTGEARPYHGKHLSKVIDEQKKLGDNIAGVESYLRKHCVDKDVERVIRQTSLPYVKEQLETQPVLTVAYSLLENDRVVFKQTQYSYLDDEKSTILCVMQDLSEAYRQFQQ